MKGKRRKRNEAEERETKWIIGMSIVVFGMMVTMALSIWLVLGVVVDSEFGIRMAAEATSTQSVSE